MDPIAPGAIPDPPSTLRCLRRLARCLAICQALLILTAVGCYPELDSTPQQEIVRPVEVMSVQLEPAAETLTLIGTTRPWREATLFFEVTGVVEDVFVEEGDMVELGAPIARLILDDYELALSKAKAELQTVQARLNLLQAGTRKEDLDAARAKLAGTQARATYWRSELKRNLGLLARNVITDSDLEQIQREHDAAMHDEASARALLDKAVAGPRGEEIEAAIADVSSRTHAVALAERQLAKTTLHAPFRGRVETRLLDPGAYVNVFPSGGLPVVHLVDLEQVDAVIAVPETHLIRLADKQQVPITSAVDSQVRAAAEVISLGQVADAASGTYELLARISNQEGRFTAGMVVTAEITHGESRPGVWVPLASICHAFGRQPYVLLVEPKENRVVEREVQLGPLAGDRAEVRSGLSDGELLIVRGHDRVVARDKVKYQPAPSAAVIPSE